jgi:hypothetical protein
MEHRYLASDESSGVWLIGPNHEYCRWQWDGDRATLQVSCDGVQHTWQVPDVERLGAAGVSLDLPETAKDVARLIERRRSTATG